MKISHNSLSMSPVYTRYSPEISGQAIAPPTEGSAPQPSPAETLPEAEKKNESKVRGENGVLRLLQEGHFKPHAEMRLLEIFHRDLAVLQAQNAPIEPPVQEAAPQPEIGQET